MSRSARDDASPSLAGSPFALPEARRRIGAAERGAEERPGRLLAMVVIGFLLASPVITLLVALP